MKQLTLLLLFLSACSASGTANLNTDSTYPADSAPGKRLIQNIQGAGLVLTNFADAPNGTLLTLNSSGVFRYTNSKGGAVAYTLNSLRDENRAYFTTPKTLRNGADTFPAYVGLILSNGVLYEAAYYYTIPQNGDDVNTRLMYDKKNINIAVPMTNTDGSLKIAAVKP